MINSAAGSGNGVSCANHVGSQWPWGEVMGRLRIASYRAAAGPFSTAAVIRNIPRGLASSATGPPARNADAPGWHLSPTLHRGRRSPRGSTGGLAAAASDGLHRSTTDAAAGRAWLFRAPTQLPPVETRWRGPAARETGHPQDETV